VLAAVSCVSPTKCAALGPGRRAAEATCLPRATRPSAGQDLAQGGGESVRLAGLAVFAAEESVVATGEGPAAAGEDVHRPGIQYGDQPVQVVGVLIRGGFGGAVGTPAAVRAAGS
jgi:hypothetical protein